MSEFKIMKKLKGNNIVRSIESIETIIKQIQNVLPIYLKIVQC